MLEKLEEVSSYQVNQATFFCAMQITVIFSCIIDMLVTKPLVA